MTYKPQNYTLVSGIGKGQYQLEAFDNALIKAGIADYNLVKVSSILPSDCKYNDTVPLGKGNIIYAAYSTITVSNGDKGETAVAVAIPDDKNDSGVIFETSYINCDQDVIETLKTMCSNAMKNRSKKVKEIKYTSQKIVGETNMFVVAISAVVMW